MGSMLCWFCEATLFGQLRLGGAVRLRWAQLVHGLRRLRVGEWAVVGGWRRPGRHCTAQFAHVSHPTWFSLHILTDATLQKPLRMLISAGPPGMLTGQ